MDSNIIINAILQLLALLIAVIGHEIMHGLFALKYGDYTAKNLGRLTINPISHIDIFGSIVIPLLLFIANAPFLFGYAKPVPVNMNEVYKNAKFGGCFFVAMAGIIYNLFVAILAVAIFKTLFQYNIVSNNDLLVYFLKSLIVINVVLAVFNIIPIPPLDGSRALAYIGLMCGSSFLAQLFSRIEKYGIIIVLLLLFLPVTNSFLSLAIDYVIVTFFRIF